jgi:hypothetical protein
MEETMKTIIAAPAAVTALIKAAVLSGVLMAFAPGIVLGDPIEKKGTAPYVTHFVFRPLMSLDVPGVGTVTTI